jgi:hypothetical protein
VTVLKKPVEEAMFILEMWDEIRRAAHCHQACEKAEDQQAVHWRVCAPEGLNHLCQKLFLSIDEHVGSVKRVLSNLILYG